MTMRLAFGLSESPIAMKRQKRSKAPPKKQHDNTPTAAKAPNKAVSRRKFLNSMSNGALVVAATAGAGWYFVDEVCATTMEHDLTRIGNGIPAVVQIHDPECAICTALQKEAREAVSNFDSDKLQFLVANIRQTKGRNLAIKHGVRHITLLLFDGKGNRKGILRGPNTAEFLTDAYRSYLPGITTK
jgi:hypothetical protein